MTASDAAAAGMIGREVSHFRVLEWIGSGGMGVVYRALDVKLNRPVALKVLPAAALSDPERRERFVREAQAASALNHPNIVTIHEIGCDAGVDFIAMELVEGRSLRAAIPQRGLPPDVVIDYATQLARGLAAAHDKGIVHRDLKPENAMVTRDGRVKILDFGLARLLPEPGAGSRGPEEPTLSEQTAPGQVLGTAGYMSPEQVRGGHIDQRSDVFSFGAVLYEMITGRRAFQGDSRIETLNAILKETPPEIAAERPDAPPALESLLRHCLEKDPERRFRSAHDIALALQAVQPARSERSGLQRPRRRWLAVIAVALVAAALAGALLGGPRPWPWAAARVQPIRSLAVLPLQNLSGDPEQEYFADGMTDALSGNLAKIAALRVISRTSALRFKGSKAPLRDIARELNVDAVVEGSVLRSGERVRISAQLVHTASDRSLWAESYERDLRDVLALQRELAQAITQEVRVKLTPQESASLAKAPSVDPEVYQTYLKGRDHYNRRSELELRRAIEAFQQAITRDPRYALAYAGLADCYNALGTVGIGQPPSATRPLAAAAATKALEIDEGLAEAHAALANANLYDWNFDAADRGYGRAAQLKPSYAPAHVGIAQLFLVGARADEAVAAARRAQELDPLSPGARWNVAYALQYARRYDEAVRQLHGVLEIDPNYLFAHWFLGITYNLEGKYAEAVEESQKAVTLSQGGPAQLGQLATAYANAGRTKEARAILAELTARSKREYVSPAAFFDATIALGDKDRAFAWLEKGAQERVNYMIYLAVQPALDPLRSDPRFQALLRRIGLPWRAATPPYDAGRNRKKS